MGAVTLAQAPGRQDLPRKPKSFPPSIAASRTEREGEIEKMEACGMAEGKGMERSRHIEEGVVASPVEEGVAAATVEERRGWPLRDLGVTGVRAARLG